MRRLVWAGRALAASASGWAIYSAYEPSGLWFMAPIGIALFMSSLAPWGRHPAPGYLPAAGLAALHSLTLYYLYLNWVGVYVGAAAGWGLAAIESLYSLAWGAGLVALARAHTTHTGPTSRILWTLLAPTLWTLSIEWVRSTWPLGGFAWTRLAWGQVSGPLLWLARLGGPALVSAATVATGLALYALARRQWRHGALTLGLCALACTLCWLQVSPGPAPDATVDQIKDATATTGLGANYTPTKDSTAESTQERTLRVAAIQGNVPRLGLDFNAQRRAVLGNHYQMTMDLAQAVKDHKLPAPDVVVWPENASDVDPFRDTAARDAITAAARAVGVPILVGTLTTPSDFTGTPAWDPTDDPTAERNTIVAWDPDRGPIGKHDKIYLQPFGEYMPARDLLRRITPLVDEAGNFTPGHGDSTLTVDTPAGQVRWGVATCYEVAFDGAFDRAIRAGAQILTVPTNNATFGFTPMSHQQLAMSRLRSVEYDRATVVAATSGISALVTPDGKVIVRTDIFRAGVLTADIPLRESRTPASFIATWLEWAMAAAGAVGVLAAVVTSRRGKMSRDVHRKVNRKVSRSTRKSRKDSR